MATNNAKHTSRDNPPQADKERLKKLFQQIDANGDGRLEIGEIRKALHLQGITTPGKAEQVVSAADANKDGLMDFSEFVEYCTDHEKKLWLVFNDLDTNKDGLIDAEEITAYMNRMGFKVSDDHVQELLKKMDKDGNVKISWDEWRDFLILQPCTQPTEIFRTWSHATFSNIGESMDSILMPDEFSEKERTTGMWWRQLIAGGGAGAVSRTCTAPLDRLKIFFQVQSLQQGQQSQFTLASCFRHMLKEGGPVSLWRGNGTNVIKIAPESAIRFFAFEKMKSLLKSTPDQTLGIHEKLFAGSTAGVIAQTTIYPLEVVKTRLALGKSKEYRGIVDCLAKVVRNEGFRGLYRGLTPSLVGIVPYAGIDLAIYETMKGIFQDDNASGSQRAGVFIPLACGTVSSTCGQLVSYPLALVRTKMQAQVGTSYGMTTLLMQTARNEGIRGLYRGIVPNFLKVIPAVGIGYVTYEQLKTILGVTTVK